MVSTIQEITIKYLEGKTLDEFAAGLGIGTSRQSVHHWKEGNRTPNPMTLFMVLASSKSTDWARTWASECLKVLQRPSLAKNQSPEPNLEHLMQGEK